MQTLGDFLDKESSAGLSLCHEVGWLMASEVLACGLDISFAPVLDVDRDTSCIIGDRSFSNNPDTVIIAAKAFIEGMAEAGMASTGKHFPGHGGVFADSHLEAPVDSRGWEQMESHDLKPFRALASNLGGIMPAHITFPAIDPFSVGFSSYWLREILRQKLGFKGVIFSDDLTMKGADVAGGYESKAKMALDAGCDMILVCNCPEGAVEVLSYMEKQNVPQNDKIGAMRSSKSVAWSDLEQSPRRLAVIEKLSSVI
jgi:beta-N-acetylhexosaminidase